MQQRFFRWFSRSLALLGLLLSVELAVRPVQAATMTVTNTADSGPGSLRQAIGDAQAGDTITFALPNPSTITLNSELVIAKNLTIQGPGAAALTISGNNATRLFFINPGAVGATSGPPATPLTVIIQDLTIANGLAWGGKGANSGWNGNGGGAAGMGGAIFSNHSALTMRGVTFRANEARGGNGENGNSRPPDFGPDQSGGNGGSVVGALGGSGPGQTGTGAPGGEGTGGAGGSPGSASSPGGTGGAGGFGGGGGGGGSIGGAGGAGGFGGGGGGGSGLLGQSDLPVAGGAGGLFGGAGGRGVYNDFRTGGNGGGGAGLGGAIFIRAGSLALVDSSFLNNSARHGSGSGGPTPGLRGQPGKGKGGAIFILAPATVAVTGCATFSGNSATSAAGNGSDTQDLYGAVLPPMPTCATALTTATPRPDAWLAGLDGTRNLTAQDFSNFCLNLHNNAASDGALINLWGCNGHNSQKWVRNADNTIRPKDYPNFCLNLHGNVGADNATINLWSCNGHNSQKWNADANHNLHPQDYPGFCLNLHGNAATNDGVINLWTCTGHNSQKWNVVAAPVSAASVAAGAVAAADTGANAPTQPLTVTALAAAPVVTNSVLVSVPVVAEAPVVTTTQPIMPVDASVAPVDANAPVAPDTSGQNQQLFLPIITNVAALAGAALGGPRGMAALVLIVLVIGGIMWRRRSHSGR